MRSFQEIRNHTHVAIEALEEFKAIMRKIEARIKLGYNYLEVDGNEELKKCLKTASISEYLEYMGFEVGMVQIKWKFK